MTFNLDLSIEVLRRSPATLQGLLDGLGEPWVRGTEGPETFSPFDVVGHLIDGEETDWIPRARIILAQGPNRRFEPYDRFRHRKRNADRTLASLLDEFARLRAANLELVCTWKVAATYIKRSTLNFGRAFSWVSYAKVWPLKEHFTLLPNIAKHEGSLSLLRTSISDPPKSCTHRRS